MTTAVKAIKQVCFIYAVLTIGLIAQSDVAYAEKVKRKIFISETVTLKQSKTVKGEVQVDETLLEFKGKMDVKKGTKGLNRVLIKWNRVNDKSFKPYFLSKFKTTSSTLVEGTRLSITGNFKKLVKYLEEKERQEVDEEETHQEGAEPAGTGEGNSPDGITSGERESYPSSSGAAAAGAGNSSNANSAAANEKPQDNKPTITYEACNPEITDSTITLRQKMISTYPDGSVEEGSCEDNKSFGIVVTSEGCGMRHDYGDGYSYQQKKRVYFDDNGTEIQIEGCTDASIKYAHSKMDADCEAYYDKGEGISYQQKKTYYVDRAGSVVFISSCKIDFNDIKHYTEDDYVREYSSVDRIDRENGVAYKRFRYYLPINDRKLYVTDYEPDLSTAMQIVKDYEQCSYYHDIESKVSYKQYSDVYYKEGEKAVVSDCQPDYTKSFNHVTDGRFCTPALNNNKLYKMVGTYFMDSTNTRVQVRECSVTGTEMVINPSDVQKNYDECTPRIDYINNKAIAYYKEQIVVGKRTEFISTCKEDPDRYYPLMETTQGCTSKVDLEKEKVYQQKRKYYNDGSESYFVSECKPTNNTFEFKRTTANCSQKLSPDNRQFIEYEELYYIDFSGEKRVIASCYPNGNLKAITEEDIQRDYSVCPYLPNMDDNKVYKQYKTFVTLNGDKKQISECTVDLNQYFFISETASGCENRVDLKTNRAIMQKRKVFNDGAKTTHLTECYDTEEIYEFQKSSEACVQHLSQDNSNVLHFEETYYIDETGAKQVVNPCSPNGKSTPIETYQVMREYEGCDHVIDLNENKVFKAYTSSIKLNGEDVQISSCTKDSNDYFEVQETREGCGYAVDYENEKAYKKRRKYYNTGTQTRYLTQCATDKDDFVDIETSTENCSQQISADNAFLLINEESYYIDDTGKKAVVSACAPNGDKVAIRETEKIRQFEGCDDDIDLKEGRAYKRYSEWYNLNGELKQISECKTDPDRRFGINETSSGCSQRVDYESGQTIKQVRKYYNDGQEDHYISQCYDSDTTFSFQSSKEGCIQRLSLDKTRILEVKETYYIDANGAKQVVQECRETGNSTPIDAASIIKRHEESCDVLLDKEQMKAYRPYNSYLRLNGEEIALKSCEIDPAVYFEIQETSAGCTARADFETSKAVVQKRKYFNDGSEDRYITQCYDTPESIPFQKSTENCEQKLSGNRTHVLEYEETFYSDPSGVKKVVIPCTATGNSTMIEESEKIRRFEDSCDVITDLSASKVYKPYNAYVELNGKEELIASCKRDETVYYDILETDQGCSLRVDDTHQQAILQKRRYFNNGMENVYITDCYDTSETIAFQTSTDRCPQQLSTDKQSIVEVEETYFIDSTGAKQVVKPCAPNGNTHLIEATEKTKRYEESCEVVLDLERSKAYRPYNAYVMLNGQREKVESCRVDEARYFSIQETYEGCGYRLDTANALAVQQKRKVYNNGAQDIYVTQCYDTTDTVAFEKSTESCTQKLSSERKSIIEVEETFFIDSAGSKQGVKPCAPNGVMHTITESEKIKLYEDSCDVILDLEQQKAYRPYNAYIMLNGQKEKVESCRVDESKYFAIQETPQGCSYRLDLEDALAIQQKRKYYNDGLEDRYVSQCYDTPDTAVFRKSTDQCTQQLSSDRKSIVEVEETFFINSAGSKQGVKPCAPSGVIHTITENEKIKLYEDSCDVILDLEQTKAFRPYNAYVMLNGQKEKVESCRMDDSKYFTIQETTQGCSYRLDLENELAIQQKRRYYNDGLKDRYVSQCYDTPVTISFQTSKERCEQELSKDRTTIMEVKETYYIDTMGVKKIVSPCSATGVSTVIPEDEKIRLVEDSCSIVSDFETHRVYKPHNVYAMVNGKKTLLKSCVVDTQRYFEILETAQGCSTRVDTQNGQAVQQKRNYFNDGNETIYLSECYDTSATITFEKSTDSCTQQLSADKQGIVEVEETFYIDSSGTKKIVKPCAPNGVIYPIAESDKEKRFETTCTVKLDFQESKAYKPYNTYITLNGKKELIDSCEVDPTHYYPIKETAQGCSIRVDTQNSLAIRQKRKYYNDGTENRYLSECYDISETIAFEKSTDHCMQKLSVDKSSVVEVEETYYIDSSGTQKIVKPCAPTGVTYPIAESDKEKHFETTCTVKLDFEESKAYKPYNTYITLNGEKTLIDSCLTDPTHYYSIEETAKGCNKRIDMETSRVVVQKQKVYNDGQSENVVSQCYDTSETIAFQKSKDNCQQQLSSDRTAILEVEETFYVDTSGVKHVVTACTETGNSFPITESEKIREYEETCDPVIDMDHSKVYRAYNEYVMLNGDKTLLNSCITDTANSYPILETAQGCSTRVDTENGMAVQQKRKYYNDGKSDLFITQCYDTPKTYAFEKSKDSCLQQLSSDRTAIVEYEETYYIDGSGVKKVVVPCTATGTQKTILETDIIRAFENSCDIIKDMEALKAFIPYNAYTVLNGDKTLLNSCQLDSNTYYDILETAQGCSDRVDYDAGQAVQQKRKYYNDGTANHYITECYDTASTIAFQKSTANCMQKLSADKQNIIEYEETYYVNSNGIKQVVNGCSPNGITHTITESEKIRRFEDSCEISLDFTESKAYKPYNAYVEINGESKQIESCLLDPAYYFEIKETAQGCSERVDYDAGQAVLQKRKYYNDGTKNVYITDCYDTAETIAFQKSVDSCHKKLSADHTSIIEYDQTYFIDSLGNKKVVSECSPNGNTHTITESDKIKSYSEACDVVIDLDAGRAYTPYNSYVIVNGEKKQISSCLIDTEKYYAIQETAQGCTKRVDMTAKKAFQQKRKVYHNSTENIYITDCYDTAVTYDFLNSTDACELGLTADNQHFIENEETFYINEVGTKVIISECAPNGNLIALTGDDYEKNYQECPVVKDYDNAKVYRQYTTYVKINGGKELVQMCQTDTGSYFTIEETPSGCENRIDSDGGKAIGQSRKFFNDGISNHYISECQDTSVTYTFQKSDEACEQKLTADKKNIINYEETFYIDGNGVKQPVYQCTPTGVLTAITPSMLDKNYDLCNNYVDHENSKVFKQYKESIALNGSNEIVSECTIDNLKYYPIQLTSTGCDYRLDFTGSEAILQKRKFYNDGVSNHYVSECTDTTETFAFQRSTEGCRQGITSDKTKVVEYEETYYIDEAGIKKAVVDCAKTGNTIAVTESDITKKYGTCNVKVDLSSGKAYQQYQSYIKLNGDDVMVEDCQVDPAKYYLIQATSTGCSPRVDLDLQAAVMQQRKYFNDGSASRYVTECMDTEVQYTFQKSTDACTQKISADATRIIEHEQTYYIDGNGVKQIVFDCAPNGNEAVIPETDINKDYEICDVFADFNQDRVYKQYAEYILLNGEKEIIRNCMPDYDAPYYAIDYDYDPCKAKNDLVNMDATLMHRLFYSAGGKDVYITECIESDISFPIQENTTDCPKLAVPDSNELIFQKSLFYLDQNSSVVTVKDCFPTDERGAIEEVLCANPWVHDQIAHQSYYNTKFRYFNQAAEEVIVKPCQYSLNFPSYQHKQEQCGLTNSDTHLKTTIKTRTYIQLEDSSKVYVSSCQNSKEVGYVYSGPTNSGWTNGSPSGCTSTRYYLWHAPYQDLINSRYVNYYMNYIRGDGTTFTKQVDRHCDKRIDCSKISDSSCSYCSGYGSYASWYKCGWNGIHP